MSNNWEMVIGLEVHAQVKTTSKLFSSSPNLFGSEPNENVNFNFLDEINKNNISEFWILCYEPGNNFQCIPPIINSNNFIKKDKIKFKLINAALYKKNL